MQTARASTTRGIRAAASGPKQDMGFYQQVYFHRLGTKTEDDTYALGKEFPRIAEIALQSSEDGRYILAAMANGDGGEFAHYLLGPDGEWRQITRLADQVSAGVFGLDGNLYLLSRQGAPRGKILRVPLKSGGLADAQVVVPESKGVIESFLPTATATLRERSGGWSFAGAHLRSERRSGRPRAR